jgi:hypothetical protein
MKANKKTFEVAIQILKSSFSTEKAFKARQSKSV